MIPATPHRPRTRISARIAARLAAALLASALVLASPARAVEPGSFPNRPIDDFERGPFSVSGATSTSVPIGGWASHAIAPSRDISLGGAAPSLSLSTSPLVDDRLFAALGTGNLCTVSYALADSTDLTAGGCVDRIDVRVAGIPGNSVAIHLATGGWSVSQWKTIPQTGQVTISYPLSYWPVQHRTEATQISLGLNGAGEYLVYDIRFGATGSQPVVFDGGTLSTSIPPVPSPPITYTAVHQGSDIWAGAATVADASTDAQTVPAATWSWSALPSLGGEVAVMSLVWSEPGGVVETDFAIRFDVSAAGGWMPDLYPPDPVHTGESIALGFPIALRHPDGSVGAASNTWLTLDFDQRQLGSLEFQDVWVSGNPLARSWTDGFTLHFRMAYSGMNSPDDVFPLFHATWTSDYTTQVPTAAPLPLPDAPGRLSLTAVPSVTRGPTELRATRPLGYAADLSIHDVAGRVVRSLRADAGAVAVRWDGRTDHGRPVPAGVYFVRLADDAGGLARVTVVR